MSWQSFNILHHCVADGNVGFVDLAQSENTWQRGSRLQSPAHRSTVDPPQKLM